jgi:hypothetical protein
MDENNLVVQQGGRQQRSAAVSLPTAPSYRPPLFACILLFVICPLITPSQD